MKIFATLLLIVCAAGAVAQAVPAGIGPGPHIMVGGGYSLFQADYGKQSLSGPTAYVDANLTWRWGVEGEARWVRFNNDPSRPYETTYLVGPRYSFSKYRVRPYVKGLAGIGIFDYPFRFARGKYFVAAPGAGLEWNRGRFAVKVIDLEYQMWPQFTFGALHPFGATTGITFRVWGSNSQMSER